VGFRSRVLDERLGYLPHVRVVDTHVEQRRFVFADEASRHPHGDECRSRTAR